MMRTCSPSRRAHAMTHRAVALGLIALACSAAGLGAQTGTGTITGHVTDSATGRPVVAVRLSVVGTDRTAVTAEDGGFVLAAVPPDQLQKTAVVSLQQALQGSVPGATVTQGDAAPGGAIAVQIRGVTSTTGDNQPLYVIDGVAVGTAGISKFTLGPSEPSFTTMTTTNPLSTLAPSDIESIDVLKDASATAIYGSRGANG